jgi:hypothetical protein
MTASAGARRGSPRRRARRARGGSAPGCARPPRTHLEAARNGGRGRRSPRHASGTRRAPPSHPPPRGAPRRARPPPPRASPLRRLDRAEPPLQSLPLGPARDGKRALEAGPRSGGVSPPRARRRPRRRGAQLARDAAAPPRSGARAVRPRSPASGRARRWPTSPPRRPALQPRARRSPARSAPAPRPGPGRSRRQERRARTRRCRAASPGRGAPAPARGRRPRAPWPPARRRPRGSPLLRPADERERPRLVARARRGAREQRPRARGGEGRGERRFERQRVGVGAEGLHQQMEERLGSARRSSDLRPGGAAPRGQRRRRPGRSPVHLVEEQRLHGVPAEDLPGEDPADLA